MEGNRGGGESGAPLPSPGWNLHWTEEVGVCLESDICEERCLELTKLLTKLPRRRAEGVLGVVMVCVIGICVGGGGRGFDKGEHWLCESKGRRRNPAAPQKKHR